jgi:acetyl esterase/lipase
MPEITLVVHQEAPPQQGAMPPQQGAPPAQQGGPPAPQGTQPGASGGQPAAPGTASASRELPQSAQGAQPTTPVFLGQLFDVKAAIRWLRANSAHCRLDPQRIGVAGYSAGGHLALLAGLTGPEDNLEGNDGSRDFSSRVQAVVNISGVVDMVFTYQTTNKKEVIRMLMGGTPEEVPEMYKAASPLTYVSPDDPPVVTIHGDQDQLVRFEQARVLDARMKEVGVPHTLVIFEGQGHVFVPEFEEKAERAMWGFLDKQLKNLRR